MIFLVLLLLIFNHFTEPMSVEYVQAKILSFEKRFNALKKTTRDTLERCRVTIKEVADALMSLPADDMDEHKVFLESHITNLCLGY